jgi:hypothetical protein
MGGARRRLGMVCDEGPRNREAGGSTGDRDNWSDLRGGSDNMQAGEAEREGRLAVRGLACQCNNSFAADQTQTQQAQ